MTYMLLCVLKMSRPYTIRMSRIWPFGHERVIDSCMQVLQAIFTWKLHTNIDNLVSELIRWGELQAYITDPFLVQPSQLGFNSTVELWPHDG